MRFPSFLSSIVWKIDRFRVKLPKHRDSSFTVWRQYPRPDATAGVLKVPLNGSGYSSRLVYARCSLTDSHPLSGYPLLGFLGIRRLETEVEAAENGWLSPGLYNVLH